jgi:hypothetical protein
VSARFVYDPRHRAEAGGAVAEQVVVVRGEGTAPARPDTVELSLTVSALEASPDAALRRTAERSEALSGLMDEAGIPPERRVTSGVTVRPQREYERQRWVDKGFFAAATTVVRLDDPAAIGDLLREAIARAEAQVDGPWWRVAPDNPARAEACRLATAEARRKAEAYAEGLGVRLGSVLSIREPNGQAAVPRVMPMAARTQAMGDETEIGVEAGHLDVSASVEVTFQLQT